MKIKNSIKNSLFAKSLKLTKSNPGKIGLMILFDIMFLISFFALQKLFRYFSTNLIIPVSFSSVFIFIIFSLIYYLIILFSYTFFKYSILDFIKSLFGKSQFSFSRLGQFYLLNILIIGVFFAIMLLFNSILVNIKQTYALYVFTLLAVPYSLFLYLVINISHSEFYEGDSIKTAIKKSFIKTFTKIKSYRETILTMILFALSLWLLFLGSGYLIRLFTSKNYSLYLSTYAYFKQASIIILDLAFYFMILINRISFYAVIKEDKN